MTVTRVAQSDENEFNNIQSVIDHIHQAVSVAPRRGGLVKRLVRWVLAFRISPRVGCQLSIIFGAIWAAAGLFDATPTNFVVGVLVSALAWIGYGAVEWVDR